MKITSIIISALVAALACNPAFAGEKHGKGWAKGRGEVEGRGAVVGKGRATGKGMVIYRDKNGKVRTKKGSGTVEGRGIAIGRGEVEGRGRAIGRGEAEGHGKAGRVGGKSRHAERHVRHVDRSVRYQARPAHVVVYPRRRVYHHHNHRVVVYRPWGHVYHGYGFYYSDAEAFKWLAFTAISLKLLDMISEEQQRLHEEAQIRATTVAVGESVRWSEGDASGSVTPVREGTSSAGRYCREFQQTITVGGKEEEAYGTACRNEDGSWEMLP